MIINKDQYQKTHKLTDAEMARLEKCCEGLDAVMKYLADLLVAGDALWRRINSVRSSQE